MIKLGNWQIHPEQQKIVLGAQSIHLEPRIMDLLLFLLQNHDAVVSRELLINQVWQGMPVSDQAITCAIAKLRKILDQDQSYDAFIETISKRGYRLDPKIPLLITAPYSPSVSPTFATVPLRVQSQSLAVTRKAHHFVVAMLLSLCGFMLLFFAI